MPDKKVAVLIGLAVIAGASLLYGILTPSAVRRQASSKGAVSPSSAPAEALGLTLEGRQAKRTQYEFWGRSPFLSRSAGAPSSVTRDLVLNGIAWDEQRPRCVINNKIAGVGSAINGNRVVRIEPQRVILDDGTGEFELRLGRKK